VVIFIVNETLSLVDYVVAFGIRSIKTIGSSIVTREWRFVLKRFMGKFSIRLAPSTGHMVVFSSMGAIFHPK